LTILACFGGISSEALLHFKLPPESASRRNKFDRIEMDGAFIIVYFLIL
jgi:hypothetical protein